MPIANERKFTLPKYVSWVITIVIIIIAFFGIYYLDLVKAGEDELASIPKKMAAEMTYEVVQSFPHDSLAFTQGLIYEDGILYESTGLYGRSSLRQVDLSTGEVLRQVDLPEAYFAEGLTDWEGSLVQLTWQEHQGFVYNNEDFTQTGEFEYLTEGWGLTQDGERLIMSDGTSTLSFLDPETFEVIGTVTVTDQGQEIININELEYVWGEIFANIWHSDDIVRIDPQTGEVLGWIDLSGLLTMEERLAGTDVLNGIAFDPEANRLFVTGKLWPKVYEIRLVPVDGE